MWCWHLLLCFRLPYCIATNVILSLACLNMSCEQSCIVGYVPGILVHWVTLYGPLVSNSTSILNTLNYFWTGSHCCSQFPEWHWSWKLGNQLWFNQWVMPKIQYSYDQLSHKVREKGFMPQFVCLKLLMKKDAYTKSRHS